MKEDANLLYGATLQCWNHFWGQSSRQDLKNKYDLGAKKNLINKASNYLKLTFPTFYQNTNHPNGSLKSMIEYLLSYIDMVINLCIKFMIWKI